MCTQKTHVSTGTTWLAGPRPASPIVHWEAGPVAVPLPEALQLRLLAQPVRLRLLVQLLPVLQLPLPPLLLLQQRGVERRGGHRPCDGRRGGGKATQTLEKCNVKYTHTHTHTTFSASKKGSRENPSSSHTFFLCISNFWSHLKSVAFFFVLKWPPKSLVCGFAGLSTNPQPQVGQFAFKDQTLTKELATGNLGL